jgi:hypothetical protein
MVSARCPHMAEGTQGKKGMNALTWRKNGRAKKGIS